MKKIEAGEKLGEEISVKDFEEAIKKANYISAGHDVYGSNTLAAQACYDLALKMYQSSPETNPIDPNEMAVGFGEWIRKFESLEIEKSNREWFIESQISSQQLLQLFKLSPEYKSLTKK